MSVFFLGYSGDDLHANHVNEYGVFFCTYLDSEIHFIELSNLYEVVKNIVNGKSGKYCIVPFKSVETLIAECNVLKINIKHESLDDVDQYIIAINSIVDLVTTNEIFRNTVTNTIHTRQSILGYIKDDISNMPAPNNMIDKWGFDGDELFECLCKKKNKLFVVATEAELNEMYMKYLQDSHDARLLEMSQAQKHKNKSVFGWLNNLFT